LVSSILVWWVLYYILGFVSSELQPQIPQIFADSHRFKIETQKGFCHSHEGHKGNHRYPRHKFRRLDTDSHGFSRIETKGRKVIRGSGKEEVRISGAGQKTPGFAEGYAGAGRRQTWDEPREGGERISYFIFHISNSTHLQGRGRGLFEALIREKGERRKRTAYEWRFVKRFETTTPPSITKSV